MTEVSYDVSETTFSDYFFHTYHLEVVSEPSCTYGEPAGAIVAADTSQTRIVKFVMTEMSHEVGISYKRS
jgi:hypothetical protein